MFRGHKHYTVYHIQGIEQYSSTAVQQYSSTAVQQYNRDSSTTAFHTTHAERWSADLFSRAKQPSTGRPQNHVYNPVRKRGKWTYGVKGRGAVERIAPFGGRSLEENYPVPLPLASPAVFLKTEKMKIKHTGI